MRGYYLSAGLLFECAQRVTIRVRTRGLLFECARGVTILVHEHLQ